jgi:hypothetical protein
MNSLKAERVFSVWCAENESSAAVVLGAIDCTTHGATGFFRMKRNAYQGTKCTNASFSLSQIERHPSATVAYVCTVFGYSSLRMYSSTRQLLLQVLL